MNLKAQIILAVIALILVHVGIRMAKWQRHLDEEDRDILELFNIQQTS